MRILVVDDNAANLDLMLYLLRSFGHDPEGKADAIAALESAGTGNFELVLADILMPDMDGYEFARRFKADAALASTPLVAVTALAMPADRKRADEAGFDGYITKPIEPLTFVSQVEAFLRTGST
jgi:two-component system cell cycle response regulator